MSAWHVWPATFEATIALPPEDDVNVDGDWKKIKSGRLFHPGEDRGWDTRSLIRDDMR